MTLPYPRKPEYISPSALSLFRRDPLLYYFRYCGPEELKPSAEFQTPAMAVGQAFDTIVKTYLGTHVPVTRRVEHEASVIARAQVMFKGWLNSGAADSMPKGLIAEPAWSHSETDKKPKVGVIRGVPVGGYPDAIWKNDETAGVIDWKVNGAYSATRPSPKDGFRFAWGNGKCIDGIEPDMPFEDIDKGWATQLAVYGFIEQLSDGHAPLNAMIEQIIGQAESDSVLVVRYLSQVSPAFQEQLIKDLSELWQAIQEERVVNAAELPTTDIHLLRSML